MKIKPTYITLLTFISLFYLSCTQEPTTDLESPSPTSKCSTLYNYLKHRLEEFHNIENSILNIVNNDEVFLWDHIESGHSGLFGNYFAIPIIKTKTQTVNHCIIIPITPYSEGEYSLYGKLEEPFILNNEKLNNIPSEFRYLYSLLFLQWQNEGLNINPQLTEYARRLQNNYIPFTDTTEISPRSSYPSSYCTIRYIVDYRIHDYTYAEDGEVCVIQISQESLRRIFLDATRSLSYYNEFKSYKLKDISPLVFDVQLEHDGNTRNIIETYMGAVENILWKEFNANKIEYQYHAYTYPTWDPIPGGNISGGGTGGGSSSGGASSTPSPIVDPHELRWNEYIENIYNKLSQRSKIFNQMQQYFEGDYPVVHLKWIYSDTLDSRVAGITIEEIDNYWLTIAINKNVLNSYPPLFIAKTMLHELIHANILLKLLSLKDSNPPNMSKEELEQLSKELNRRNYPTLYYYYDKYKDNAPSQHAYMSDYHVEVITNALQEFSPTSDYKTCEAIAWQGLKTMITRVFDQSNNRYYYKEEKTPGWEALGEQKQHEIDNIYKEYMRQGSRDF